MEALAVAVGVVQTFVGGASLFFLVGEVVAATGGVLTPEAAGAYVLFHRTTVLGLPLGWFLVIELAVWGLGYAAVDGLTGGWATNEDRILWPFTLPFGLIDGVRIRQEQGKWKVSDSPRGGLSAVLVILGLLIAAILLARAFGIVR